MESLISALREIIGTPDFYQAGQWNYAAMIEYLVASMIVLVVVSSVFKILVRCFDR